MPGSADTERAGPREPSLDRRAAVGVVESLARLLSLAAIYPPTHARVLELAGPVAEAVREICGGSDTLSVDVTEKGLTVGDTLVTEQSPGVARLRKDLDLLGATCLVLHREIAPEHLLAFAKSLRTRRASASQGQELTHVRIEGLPPTVQLLQRDFGIPSFDESEVPLPAGAVLGPGGAGGMPVGELDQATRRELQVLVRSALASRSVPAGEPVSPGAPNSRREIVRAVAEAVRRALDQRVGRGAVRSVSKVIGEAERTLSVVGKGVETAPILDAIRESIDLHLRDSFLGELSAVFEKGQAVSREGIEYELTLRDLAHEMETFVLEAPVFRATRAELDVEHLSVYLQLLSGPSSAAAQAATGQRVAALLASGLTDPVRRVLAGWLRDLALSGDAAALDAALPVVVPPLRRASPEAVAELLLAAAKPIRAAALKALWPHMAVDLLVGSEDRPRPHDEETILLLSRFGAERMREGVARLSTLLALRAGEPARRLFLPPRPDLFGLYEVLLEMREPPAYGELVFEAFHRFPVSHPASVALRVLPRADGAGRAFLADLLRDVARTESGGAGDLSRRASEILAGALRSTPPRRRKEPWVVEAIGALRSLPTPEAAGLLSEIRDARRLLVLPVWPLPCRRAALAAAPPALPSTNGAPTAARGAA